MADSNPLLSWWTDKQLTKGAAAFTQIGESCRENGTASDSEDAAQSLRDINAEIARRSRS